MQAYTRAQSSSSETRIHTYCHMLIAANGQTGTSTSSARGPRARVRAAPHVRAPIAAAGSPCIWHLVSGYARLSAVCLPSSLLRESVRMSWSNIQGRYAYTYTYILTYVYTYIHMYVCICVCMYVCVCVCIYIYIYNGKRGSERIREGDKIKSDDARARTLER
jgi:hypothetical protein